MKKSQFRASLLAASALSVSIASQLHAAAFVSTALGGTWEDPLTWTTAGFPDTFLNDSATITGGAVVAYDDLDLDGDGGVSTPATPYTTIEGLVPGGLSVANGNSITIEGGSSLTQVNLNHEIRIGEGAGFQSAGATPSGAGTLTINGGSSFFSGSSLGVAVGSDIDNNTANGTGNGTVNLNEGLFVMEAGAPGLPIPITPAALGVGIEGATGVFNVGDGVGVADATLDLLASNSSLGAGVTNQLPGSIAGNGTVNVKVDGVIAFGTGGLTFGDTTGGVGLLNVDGGTVGSGAASTSEIRIGNDGGTGTLTMTSGLINSAGDLNVGRGAGSTGLATISGGIVNANHLIFGAVGNATLNLSGGATQLNSANYMNVGADGGVGLVNQTGGAVTYTQWSAIGVGAGPAGSTWDISGGSITSGAGFEVGSDRDGTFNVSGTAVVNVGPLEAGIRAGSNGHINITGGTVTTSKLGIAGAQAGSAAGDATITGTANVTIISGGGQSYIGNNGGSVGTLNVIGSTVNNVSGEDWQIGFNGGTGNLNVAGGGKVNHNWWFNVARGGSSTGKVTIDGAGSEINIVGPGAGGNGGRNDLHSNIGEDGTGTMDVTNGGKFTHNAHNDYRTFVGRNGGSNGFLNVDGAGSSFNATELFVGNGGGNGLVNVLNGGKVTAQNWMSVGAGGTGQVNIDGVGSTLNTESPILGRNGGHGGDIMVGQSGGNGRVNVTNGGQWENGWWLFIARDGGSTGRVDVQDPGSKLTVGYATGPLTPGDVRLFVGESGNGTLNITNGGRVEVLTGETNIAANGGSTGNMLIDTGGTFYTAGNINVGQNGTGTLNILDANALGTTITGNSTDGMVNAFNVGGDSTGVGVLNINLADPAGKVISREIYAGWGSNGVDTGSGTINVLKGTLQTDGWVEIGRGQQNDGNTGTVNVDGPQARWERGTLATSTAGDRGARDMNIGQGENPNFGKGYLNVKNGGTVNHNWWINLGRQSGSEGHITVDGVGSTINMVDAHTHGLGGDGNSQLNVGEGGTGTVDITNGGVFTHNLDNGGGEVWIARNDGATGTMTVDGAGSQFNSFGREFRIAGNAGIGTLNITNGGLVDFQSHRENGIRADGNFGVSENNAGTGRINMNGGQLNITAWSLFSAWNQATTNARIDMLNSNINIRDTQYIDGGGNPGNGGHLFWGDAGTALIDQDGGSITAQGWSAIGRERGGNSTYNLGMGTATGSVPNMGGSFSVGGLGGNELYVGRQSHGTINMGVGTTITVAGTMSLAQETSPTTPSSGTVNNLGGALSVGGEFNVGRNGVNANVGTYTQTLGSLVVNGEVFVGRDSTQGTLNVLGGVAQLNNNLGIGMGGGGSIGTVNVANPGTVMTVNGWTTLGRDTGGAPTSSTLNIKDGALWQHLPSGSGDLLAGWQNGSTAAINVTNGGQMIQNWWARFGVDPGSRGDMLVDGVGSTYNQDTGRTYIGERGIGTLTVTNGGTFDVTNGDQFFVGGADDRNVGEGDGTLTVSGVGSRVSTNNFIRVGGGANGLDPSVGKVVLSSGGTINGGNWIGFGHEGGDGTLTMTGGAINVNNEFYVGIDDNGHARQTTGLANIIGGTVNAGTMIVGRSGGKGIANISGGTVTATNSVEVGVNGSSTFQISNYATADAVIDGGPELAFSFTANYSTSNTQDNGAAGGPFGLGVQVQGLPGGDNDDFAFVGLGNFTVDTTGSYVFSNDTDDGSRLRLSINGGLFTEIITDNILSGPHTVSSAAQALNAGDIIQLEWMWFERGGGAEGETFYSRDGGANALWEDASQGLTLAGGIYSGTVFKSATTVTIGDGTLNLTGGILKTQFVRAGAGTASLSLDGGTLQALGDEADFIRSFDNVGTHSAIDIKPGDGTIDTNGFNVRITASSVIDNPGDALIDGLAGSVLNKDGAGQLTIEGAAGDGFLSVEVKAGILDFESSQTLDALVIDGGATVTLSDPATPPAPAVAAGALFDEASLAVTHAQGVPEPGTIGLLLVSALGLLGRRSRRKES